MLVLKALNGVCVTSKADSFLKNFFIYFLTLEQQTWMDAKEKRKRDRYRCYNLRKEASTEEFSKLMPPHVTVFREIQHLYSCDPFLLNQNLQSFHLGFCKNPSISSFLCYYSLHNLLLFLWCKIILLTDATERSNSNYF